MTLRALLFGSIGTLVETSELQRTSYNRAFETAGLGWRWERDEYRSLLSIPGGLARLRAYRDLHVDRSFVDEDHLRRVHRLKTENFIQSLTWDAIPPRPGVTRMIHAAQRTGVRLGLASTTDPVTVETILTRMAPRWGNAPFEVVLDRTQVAREKPMGDVYRLALERLGLERTEAIAVEDTPESLAAADAAGVACIALPGAFAADRAFPAAAAVVSGLGDPGLEPVASDAAEELEDGMVTLDWLAAVLASRVEQAAPAG
ncbi:MAG: HAD-IA family hydrolase [Planctomycetota bacterium]